MAGNPAVVQSMIKEHEQHVMELFKTIDKLANKYNVRITIYKSNLQWNSWYPNQYKTGSRKHMMSKPIQNRKSQTADTLISNNHMRLETVSFATVKYRVYRRKSKLTRQY